MLLRRMKPDNRGRCPMQQFIGLRNWVSDDYAARFNARPLALAGYFSTGSRNRQCGVIGACDGGDAGGVRLGGLAAAACGEGAETLSRIS
jgi:hypothetical protein